MFVTGDIHLVPFHQAALLALMGFPHRLAEYLNMEALWSTIISEYHHGIRKECTRYVQYPILDLFALTCTFPQMRPF